MPPRSNQNLATWLMLIPLLVVPAIAVFGLPQFTPHSAQAESSSRDPELRLGAPGDMQPFPNDRIRSGDEAPRFSDSPRAPSHDPFANPQFNNTPSDLGDAPLFAPDLSSASKASSNPSQDPFAQPPREGISPRPAEPASEVAPDNDPTPANPRDDHELARQQLSWRQAVQRLNELGVRQYSLEPAGEPYLFRFTCDFTPEDNPRVTHRFEAEAGEPLRAVQKVLQQVETWLAQRNAQ